MSLSPEFVEKLDRFHRDVKRGAWLYEIHPNDDHILVDIIVDALQAANPDKIHVDWVRGWAREAGWSEDEIAMLTIIFETTAHALRRVGKIQ